MGNNSVETQKNLAKALLGLQSELMPIVKNTKAYNYDYAPLEVIVESIKNLLAKHGISYTQQSCEPFIDGQVTLRTTIFHVESGESASGVIFVPWERNAKNSPAQQYGAAMTYARRYALCAALGVTVEKEDADGVVPQKTKEEKAKDWATTAPAFLEALRAYPDIYSELKAKLEAVL